VEKHQQSCTPGIPEGDEACRVVAIATTISAALKGPAVDACINVAPQD
jgi:hypothetical protein